MSSVPASIKRIGLKTTEKRWRHRFPHYKSIGALFCHGNHSFGWLCWGLTSQSTIFQSCRDGAIASWVINQYFRGVKCLAQGHNTAAVGLEPRTSRSRVRHSTTEPPRSPPQFWSNLPQNLMQPFPHPSDATPIIWSRLANWLQRYSSLKVWTTTDDDGRTDDVPLVYYKLTLWAFGSGELNKLKVYVISELIQFCYFFIILLFKDNQNACNEQTITAYTFSIKTWP